MRLLIIPATILTLIFAWTTVFAHEDRIEKPKTYKLTFLDGQTVTLNNDNSDLTTYCKDLVEGKRKLIKAELTFATGETLTFESDGDKLTKIQIADKKKEIIIPDLTLKKISMIHFQTIALLWDGRHEKAFSASYFYIRLDIGHEKSINEYPELHLIFSDNEFVKSEVWRKTSENSKQRADF
jgi:hypothetical protein